MSEYTILIVDDNPDVLDVLDLTLSQDYRVFKANSALEGLDILKREEVDLTIADQRMPGMTGVEFLEKTLDNNPNMVKILLTGFAETEDLIKAINQGRVYKYISKPFKPVSAVVQGG